MDAVLPDGTHEGLDTTGVDVPVAGPLHDVKPPLPPPSLLLEAIAPWWHTVAVMVCFGFYAVLSHVRQSQGSQVVAASHWITYASQMWLSWVLFGAMVAGLYHRVDFFRATMRRRGAPWAVEIRRALTTYISVYLMAGVLVGGFAGVKSLRESHAQKEAQAQSEHAPKEKQADAKQQHAGPVTPTPVPAPKFDVKTTTNEGGWEKMFDNRIVRSLAPKTLPEMLLWLLVSATAGFVEEHVFRGYLLRQLLSAFTRIRCSPMLTRVLAVGLSSALFGSLHLYEGIGGAAFIACLGAVYACLVLRYGNLRSVVVAHFAQDALAGFFLYVHYAHAGR